MRRFMSFAVLAILGMALASCGASLEKAVVGKYHLDLNTDKMQAKEKAAADMMKGMLTGVSMDIKADHTINMSAMGKDETGTWKIDGDKLKITPKGQKEGTFEVKDGGKTLIPDAKAMGMPDMKGAEISFKKDEK